MPGRRAADRRGRGVGRIDVGQAHRDPGARIQAAVSFAVATLPAASVTDAVTDQRAVTQLERSAVVL
jgi:hypothetical protein